MMDSASNFTNDDHLQSLFTYKNIRQEFETESDVLKRKHQEELNVSGKENDFQVNLNEISETLDYTRLLLNEKTVSNDFQEIKLRNSKLENDLIYSNEQHLTELSKVRENYENKIRFKTSELQTEIDELKHSKDQVDLENSQRIDELHEVIELERNAQKQKFRDIVAHYQNVLDRTFVISTQMDQDFSVTKTKTTALKDQVANMEINLINEFSNNFNNLINELPFVSEMAAIVTSDETLPKKEIENPKMPEVTPSVVMPKPI